MSLRFRFTMVFTLRQPQIATIGTTLRPELVGRYLEHLRGSFCEALASLPDDALREQVIETLGRARALGVDAPADDIRFLNLAVTFGWHFDREFPWVGPMMRDPAVLRGSERLRRVKARFVRHLAVVEQNLEARRAFDPAR